MIWKNKYRIGVSLIDEQHEELFQRVSDFVSTIRSKGEWTEKVDKVNETLAFMMDYVVTHFREEEAYQLEVGYPEYETHKKIHEDMVGYVVDVANKAKIDGFDEEVMQQFAGKLLAWLINHVAATDQKIAEFVKEKEEVIHE